MQTYDFDKVIDRHNTGALKTDVLAERYGRSDLLPLWVADMDFETPPFIIDAIRRRLDHPIFGYTVEPTGYWPAVAAWVEKQHGWKVRTEWMTYIPGIVKGIGMVVSLFTGPDDKIIIQPPVYHPFRLVPEGNGRVIVHNPLRETSDGSYEMDFDNLERVADSKCKILILSNPHNPAGVVWDRDTLVRLADFCHKRSILVISDEIHCDLTLGTHRHLPFASVSEAAAMCSITFQAPSKTFNIAGIVSSYAIVPDAELRRRFFGWLQANELNEPAIFAPIATMAAYTQQGDEWRRQMLAYIERNIDFVTEYCTRNMPEIKPWRPQASFLVWLDCRALGMNRQQLADLFINRAHLALNDGAMFGPGGEGFMRLNVGAPRTVVKEALDRLCEALKGCR